MTEQTEPREVNWKRLLLGAAAIAALAASALIYSAIRPHVPASFRPITDAGATAVYEELEVAATAVSEMP